MIVIGYDNMFFIIAENYGKTVKNRIRFFDSAAVSRIFGGRFMQLFQRRNSHVSAALQGNIVIIISVIFRILKM